MSPKNPYYSAPEKREDVGDSLGEEDEESGMIDAATSDGGTDFVKKLKKRRKKKQGKEIKKSEEYINILQIVSLIMFMAGALGLISISALRFTTVETQGVHDAILNFYFLFLGICQALVQLNVSCIKRNFRCLNYYWGKSLYCLFLCTMSYSTDNKAWIQYVMTVYFMILGVCFSILACFRRSVDREQEEKDEIEQTEWLEAQKGKPDATDEFVKKINKRHK